MTLDFRRPVKQLPPGHFIREELEARHWTQEDLARIIGHPITTIKLLINGRRIITGQIAIELGRAFGTGPAVWLNQQLGYKLWKLWKLGKTKELKRIRERYGRPSHH